MNLNPQNQMKIYGLEHHFNELKNLYEKKKLPNKILFSGLKGSGKSTLAYHLINFILSKGEEFSYDLKNFKINETSKTYKLLSNKSHPNFFLLDVNSEKKNN